MDKSSIFLATFKDELKNSQLYFWKNIPNQFLVAVSDSTERYGIYSRMRPQVIAFFIFWSKKFAYKPWNEIISDVALNIVDKILSTIAQYLGSYLGNPPKFSMFFSIDSKASTGRKLREKKHGKFHGTWIPDATHSANILGTKSRRQNISDKISATKSH